VNDFGRRRQLLFVQMGTSKASIESSHLLAGDGLLRVVANHCRKRSLRHAFLGHGWLASQYN
jgi:hypothetical protein